MPRRTRYAGLDIATIGGRFEHLLKHAWGGRQREMAADLGVTQGLISKVARGEQAPGPKLIEALAAHPKVNARWLLEGVGEPLAAPDRTLPTGDLSLPVSRCILPGHPENHASLLTGFRFQVETLLRPSAYLLEVQADAPVIRVPELRVAAGDLLVMETDRGVWLSNRMVLVGKLVALRLGGDHGVDFVLARVRSDPMARELVFDCFGVQGPPAPAEAAATPSASEGSDTSPTAPRPEVGGTESSVAASQRGRGVMLRRTGPPAGTPAQAEPILPTPPTEPAPDSRKEVRQVLISISDVVGYCALLIRT